LLEKENKKVIKVSSLVFVVICVVSLYFYMTRPVDITDITSIGIIKKIDVNVSLTGTNNYGLPSRLKLGFDNEQDINAIMNILNKYKYSKTLKFNNPRVVPANPTNGVIDIYLFYTTADNKKMNQYIFIDTENYVAIRNKSGINIHYKIVGSNKSLFEDLSSWLSENWSSKKQF
jgi:hypothetical protein